ncbi:MAG: M42 family metallopeptidase [Thermodesulfobacteriota bacterium]
MIHGEQRDHALKLLTELTEAFGVSGFEEEVRNKIRARVEPLADRLEVDSIGNLYAVLNPYGRITLMLDAHMDEVGLVVRGLEKDGFLRVAPVGGWDVRLLPGQSILVRGSKGRLYEGLVGSIPPHVQEAEEKNRVFGWKDLFVDVGAKDIEELKKMGIRLGCAAVVPQSLKVLGDGKVMAKALDDRVGCALLILTLENLCKRKPQDRVVFTFSSSEEVGCRGARVAAHRLGPKLALAVEGTMATDTPEVRPDQRVSALGGGPVITTMDKSLIVPEKVVDWIIDTAERLGIPYQIKTPLVGSTDAGAIQSSGMGVLTGVISVPCRYGHSPTSLMSLEDFFNTQRLLEALIQEASCIYDR